MAKRVLGFFCTSVLVIILTAGLWPFHGPKNQVTWLRDGNGLHFGSYGIILGPNAFALANPRETTSCSVEIWLRPDIVSVGGTILAFYSPQARTVGFSLHQSIDDLLLRRGTAYGNRAKANLYIEHLFSKSKQLFITITSNPKGTVVYLNGVPVRTSPQFGLSSKDLTGQLVVGNHPLADDGWQGQLRGLAIYNQELSAAEVLRHYDAWTRNQQIGIENEGPAALYLFKERMGNTVHNQMSLSTDLRIPENYFVLHPPFLEPFWDEFQPGWSYWKNVLINIGGFVPLGFVFCAYFTSVRRLDRAVLATVLLGGVVSLTIEVLQAFLPTRNSGTTDLITNTIGTTIGAVAYTRESLQALFARVGRRELLQPACKR